MQEMEARITESSAHLTHANERIAVATSMGAISDARGIQAAFWIPVFCYGVVLHFALRGHRHSASVAS